MTLPFRSILFPILSGATAALAADAPITAETFRTQLAPVLEAKCVACHRPDNTKGRLDITTHAALLRGGKEGDDLVAGKPDESAIYTLAIPEEGKKPEMPKKGDALSAAEAEALRAWISAGAPWPEGLTLREKAKADKSFWSFAPLATVIPPPVDVATMPGWEKNPIDAFIWQKLQEKQLRPNPPAEPRSFIRRASFDVTGLPPTPEEVEAFVVACETNREQAVGALVDRLLASPHYGEQWGRHWLDVVRFGESRGYERNQIITNLWPFRDYVVSSLNADKSFAQFIREHLAGDILGKGHPEIEVGSAFLVAGAYDDVDNQDPIAIAQIRADQMDEMIRATSEAFLGMTLGCARCHDHKFDPLLTKDYYSLYSTFAGTVYGERALVTPEQAAQSAEKRAPLEAKREQLRAERTAQEKVLAERFQAAEPEAAKAWTRPKASRYGTEETFPALEAKLVRLSVEGNDIQTPRSNGFRLDEFEVWSDEANPRNVALASAGASATGRAPEAKDFAGAYGPDFVMDGKFGERWHTAGNELVITLAKAERINRVLFSSDRLKALPENSDITTFVGDYRIEVSLDGKEWRQVASSADRTPISPVRKEARLKQLTTTPEDTSRRQQLEGELATINAAINQIPNPAPLWVGNHKPAPGPFKVMLGGSPQRLGDEVQPASLSVFDGHASSYHLDLALPEGDRRVALANWMTAEDNPLPARVLANRIWHYHFGTGIVDTPSDFGYMGSRPTHPELLDWLASQLQANGWKLKPLHRLLLTSQTYQQSTAWRAEASSVDGDSRLIWRFPPRRLTAEEVRDTLLAVAGKLNLTMGGPGFRLYDYQQDNVATYVPLDVHDASTYRRAIYHHNARAARVDVMTDFDCPDPAFADPRRASTTTPLQALTLMNHSFAIDMAQALALRLEAEAPERTGQVQRAFVLAYGRPARPDEITKALPLIQNYSLRAFCRALLNSNELINLN